MAVDVARRIVSRPEVVNVPPGGDFIRVQRIYQIVYGRQPKPANPRTGEPSEIDMAIRFVSGEMKKQAETASEMKDVTAKAETKATKRVENLANTSNATKAIQNVGEVVDRKILSPWETFAQLLLLSNEAAYIN
jgi:hypothetical protein